VVCSRSLAHFRQYWNLNSSADKSFEEAKRTEDEELVDGDLGSSALTPFLLRERMFPSRSVSLYSTSALSLFSFGRATCMARSRSRLGKESSLGGKKLFEKARRMRMALEMHAPSSTKSSSLLRGRRIDERTFYRECSHIATCELHRPQDTKMPGKLSQVM
jgi:hypothetical protein